MVVAEIINFAQSQPQGAAFGRRGTRVVPFEIILNTNGIRSTVVKMIHHRSQFANNASWPGSLNE